MQTHELKTWPREYEAIVCGDKCFELRRNDRDFRVHDDLLLREWDPHVEEYTGRQCWAHVTYVLTGGQFGLPLGMAILSICDVEIEDDGTVYNSEPENTPQAGSADQTQSPEEQEKP